MSAPQIAAPGETDLGSAQNQDVAGLIDPPAAIPQVGPTEPLLRPDRGSQADSGTGLAGELGEQTSSDEELATVTDLRSSTVDGVAGSADHEETTTSEGPVEDARVAPGDPQPAARSAGAEAAPAAPTASAPPVAPAPPPAPEPPQEPKRRRFPGADFYPAIFWISVLVGLAGQITGFGEQFGGLWYSYAGAVVVGGIFELTMITAGDASMRRIARARPAYEWLPFLLISLTAAVVAAYMNFTHWVWAGATMAVYFGGLTVGGYLGHLIEGVFDALQDRRATREYEQAKRDYELAKAEEAAEARKAWKRYQRSLTPAAAETTSAGSAKPRTTSAPKKASASSANSQLLEAIVEFALQRNLGARAARNQYIEQYGPKRSAVPSEPTVKRALSARKSASAS